MGKARNPSNVFVPEHNEQIREQLQQYLLNNKIIFPDFCDSLRADHYYFSKWFEGRIELSEAMIEHILNEIEQDQKKGL